MQPQAELLRENKRMLDRAIRELDRERMGLQNQARAAGGEQAGASVAAVCGSVDGRMQMVASTRSP